MITIISAINVNISRNDAEINRKTKNAVLQEECPSDQFLHPVTIACLTSSAINYALSSIHQSTRSTL